MLKLKELHVLIRRSKIAKPLRYGCVVALIAALLTTDGSAFVAAQVLKATTVRKEAKARPATLTELYMMFFTFAAHIEAKSNADGKLGVDRTFYRHTLQRSSGLTSEEYALVLASAQRFVEADEQAMKLMEDRQSDPDQVASIMKRRSATLSNEIAKLRQSLGTERADVLGTYLQTKYIMGRIGSSPTSAKSPKTLSEKSVDEQASDNLVDTGEPPNNCNPYTYYNDDGSTGTATVCAEARMTYLGPTNQVEFLEITSPSCDDEDGCAIDPSTITAEGDAYVDNAQYDDASVSDYGCYSPSASCNDGGQPLNFGPDTTYLLAATGEAAWNYDSVDCDPDWCGNGEGSFPDTGNFPGQDNPIAYVYIEYAGIDSLSTTTIDPSQSSGSITIYGDNLVSPFSNSPSVTYTGSLFSNLTVKSGFSESQITVQYTLSSTVCPSGGTTELIVNNGFGSDSNSQYTITINPCTPDIAGISVSSVPAYPLDDGALVAGNTQTVTLTGTNFGTAAPTITVASGSDSQYVQIDSISVPSSVRASMKPKAIAHTAETRSPSATEASDYTQSVSFTVNVDPDAILGSVQFVLAANDGAQPSAPSPPAPLDPVTPAPQVMIVTSATNVANANCANGTLAPNGANEMNVMAGQLIMLCVLPPPAGFNIVSQSWWFEDNADITGGFTGFNGTGLPSAANGGAEAADPILTQDGSAALPIQFYFVNPGTTETAFYQWTLSNGDSNGNSSTADFNIQGPTGVNIPAPSTNPIVLLPVPGSNETVATMQFGANNTNIPGITFRASSNPTWTTGTFQWVQILTADLTEEMWSNTAGGTIGPKYCQPFPLGIYTGPSTWPAVSSTNPYLDAVYPYLTGIMTQNIPTITAQDSPGVTTTTEYGEESQTEFNATMFLMWDPTIPVFDQTRCTAAYVDNQNQAHPSTCSSTPVPLGSISWSYSGCTINNLSVQNDGTNWSFACSNIGHISAFIPAGYPQWQYTMPSSSTNGGNVNLSCQNE